MATKKNIGSVEGLLAAAIEMIDKAMNNEGEDRLGANHREMVGQAGQILADVLRQ